MRYGPGVVRLTVDYTGTYLIPFALRELGSPRSGLLRWPTNMDPVYMDVKGRTTRYCVLFLAKTQDVDILHELARPFFE